MVLVLNIGGVGVVLVFTVGLVLLEAIVELILQSNDRSRSSIRINSRSRSSHPYY